LHVSPFDHPLLSGLLGDEEAAALFSADAELRAMLGFDAALARAEAAAGVIPNEAAKAISAALDRFRPDMASLAAGTARDGVVVPELVAQLREAVGAPHERHVHFGATSQDVVDTGLALRLSTLIDILDRRLRAVIGALDALSARIVDNFERQSGALHTSALMLDDGIIDPRDTRRVLAFALQTCAEAQARDIRPMQFGVARP